MKAIKTLIALLSLPLFVWAEGWEPVNATYSVPVPEHLMEYSEYPLEDLEKRTRDGVTEYKYTLPLELTGVDQEIHFVAGESNKSTRSQCQQDSCRISYSNLEFDEGIVATVLKEKNLSPVEFTARMEVFSLFRGDPEGVIHFHDTQSGAQY